MSQLTLGAGPDAEPHCIVIPWYIDDPIDGRVTIILPDNQKTAFHVVKGKRVVGNDKAYDRAKATVHNRARNALADLRLPIFRDVTLRAEYQVWYPDAIKRDKFNYMKMLNDALTGVIWKDDCMLVDSRVVVMGIDRQRPRIEVTVHPHPTDHAWLIPKPGTTRRRPRGKRRASRRTGSR